jgi:deoxyadenosine/deoxycytidine kinase
MYISISGNTGAGKSALGRYLAERLNVYTPVAYVEERTFHHNLIQRMFDSPKEYAFLIQMNFLVQRTLKIKDMIEHQQSFLIERSVEEDFLFALRYHREGSIDETTFQVYKEFWQICQRQVPQPSLYIYLQSDDIDLLTNRVINGYKISERKQELPIGKLKDYVRDMNILYDNWFDGLQANKIKMPIFTNDFSKDVNFERLLAQILKTLGLK